MKNKVLNGLLGFALVLLLWQLGSMALQKPFLPTPGASFAAFFEFLFYGEMGRHFLISSGRILCSILLAVVLAVPLGLAMGRINWLGRILNPIVYILYPLPKVVFFAYHCSIDGFGQLAKDFSDYISGVFPDCCCHPRCGQQYSAGQCAVHALAERHTMADVPAFDIAKLSAADFDLTAHHIGHGHCHFIFCRNLCFF